MIPTEVDGMPIWVEAVVEPGEEPTAFGRKIGERLPEIFAHAKIAIAYLSREALEAARDVAKEVASPEQIEIQFGLKFSTQGSIIIAGSTLESSLSVKIIYSKSAISADREDASEGTSLGEVSRDAV